MENPNTETTQAQEEGMHSKSISYFLQMYPLLLSFGFGGSIIGLFYTILNCIYTWVRNKLVCSIKVMDSDETFKWVSKYMKDMGFIREDAALKAKIKEDDEPWWESIFKVEKKKPEVEYKPGPGDHIIKFKGRTLWINCHEGETMITGWERVPTNPQEINIMAYGTDTAIIKDFINEAVEHCMKKDSNLISIYEQHRWGLGWTKAQSKKPRELESVVLNSNLQQELIQDIKRFQNSAQWYMDKGVPYRRGYLLYGPPGTGKTSFTTAIAGALKLNICYLNLSSGNMDDDGLNRALNNAPSQSIILLEDIDGIFVSRESVNQNEEGRRVSFSGLLNALDGVRSQEGRILFMTTNHREKLDPALLRPGRADFHAFLGNASFSQMTGLFKRFYPGEDQMADDFAKKLPEFKISMAKLQGHFLKNRDQAKSALDNYKLLLEDDQAMEEITVFEYLKRLNLSKYCSNFAEQKISQISDLRFFSDEGAMETQFKMKNIMERKRIVQMISGDKLTKDNFALLSVNGAKQILKSYIKNNKMLEEIIECIEPDTISSFELKDVLNEIFDIEGIKSAITEKVNATQEMKDIGYDMRLMPEFKEKEEETEDQKKKRIGVPSDDTEALLKEFGCEESIAKIKEHMITDYQFWQLTEDEIKDMLEVKTFGTRKKLIKKMNQIKKDHEEYMEMLHKEEQKLNTEGIKLLLCKTKSTKSTN